MSSSRCLFALPGDITRIKSVMAVAGNRRTEFLANPPPCFGAVGISDTTDQNELFSLQGMNEEIAEVARHPLNFLRVSFGQKSGIFQAHLLCARLRGRQDAAVLRRSAFDGGPD